ncbi:MAG: heme peroxidase, partial [Acidobacteria bacterium]|nr:heme peroxidase [Acidobacteriota bacterium]
QPAYKIDSSLVNPLALLPEFVKKNASFTSLAQRNLRRGNTMGLPSGQDVARFMGLEPLKDFQLKVGKATQEDSKKKNKTIDQVSSAFAGKAPLWFYILSEAQAAYNNPKTKDDTPTRLGEVGGRIVAEVIIGLLLGDSHSFLSQAPGWEPELQNSKGQFGMAELIKQSITV